MTRDRSGLLHSVRRNPSVLLLLAAFLVSAMTTSVLAQAGGTDILAQVSEATARVAEQASPAVVGNADLVIVTVGENQPVKAEVVGTDPPTDLAVIKIQGSADLPVLPLGDSDKLRVGDWVIAIGQPFGLTHTVTKGIISALNRKQMHLTTYEDFIQTDVAINPGNSGGPLVNRDGQVVGINTAILGSAGNIGIGFSIPVNMARDVYEQIVKTGRVTRGYLGVDIQELTPDLATVFGLPADVNGIVVTHIAAKSPAQQVGLRQGDVITQFDGPPIQDATTLQSQIASMKPGSQVSLVVLRDGKPNNITVQLGMRPTQPPTTTKKGETQAIIEVLGMAVQDLTPELAERLDYQGLAGVLILAVEDNSIADASGLAAGMLIQEINRQPVKNMNQFEQALDAAAQKPPILFLVDSQGSYRYIVINLPQQGVEPRP